MSTETMTLEVPTQLYTELSVLAIEEHTDLVGVLTRLLKLAEQELSGVDQPDPVFELIGAYRSDQPLVDNIPVSEDPDLYLVWAASGESPVEKHAWEIAPARYTQGLDGRPVRVGVVAEKKP